MLLISARTSYGVVSSSLVSLALLLFLVAVTFQNQPQGTNPVLSPEIPPHVVDATEQGTAMYRAREVAAQEGAAGRLKKFMLQERTGSGGASERSWRNLSFKEVARLWKSRGEFVDVFIGSIQEIGFEAVFFESAPVTRNTINKPYEYVLVDSPRLASVSADGRAFAEYIASGEGTNEVTSFRNLRKDARLVVPFKGQQKPGANYAHLAAFVRTAPKEQVVNFFAAVGEALEEEVASTIGEQPVWLSTSGLGVYWLHARLDSVPKYYTYAPYTTV